MRTNRNTERKKIKKRKNFIDTDEVLRYQRNSFTFLFKTGTTEFLQNL